MNKNYIVLLQISLLQTNFGKVVKKMALRTYGDKPASFQLEENGEFYYIGSEVTSY